jgi:hypothetical protein
MRLGARPAVMGILFLAATTRNRKSAGLANFVYNIKRLLFLRRIGGVEGGRYATALCAFPQTKARRNRSTVQSAEHSR